MKISFEHVGRILESHFNRVQKTGADKAPTSPAKADRATFSAKAEEIESALRVIAELPEVRADKVAELKEKIANGTFEVSSEAVADEMLAEANLEKLLGG